MLRQTFAAALAVASMALAGCVSPAGGVSTDVAAALAGDAATVAGVERALAAANLTAAGYCALAPEARAEIRRKLRLRVQILACPGDAVAGNPPP